MAGQSPQGGYSLMLKMQYTVADNLNRGFTALLVASSVGPYAANPHGPARNSH